MFLNPKNKKPKVILKTYIMKKARKNVDCCLFLPQVLPTKEN